MFQITDLKIGTRLFLGFGLVLLCASLLLLLGLWRMSDLHDNTETIVTSKVLSLSNSLQMRETGGAVALSMRKVVTPTDAAEGVREKKLQEDLLAAYVKFEEELQQLSSDPQSKTILAETTASKQAVVQGIQKIHAFITEGNYFDASSFLKTDFVGLHDKWMASLVKLADHHQTEMRTSYEASQTLYQQTRFGLLAVGLLTLAIGAAISLFITRTITRPLQYAAQIADTIASGDLTGSIEKGSSDEAGQLLNSLSTMQRNLVRAVHQIKVGTEAISSASQEIASGNADLSARTESQAGSLEETASSMEELTSTVKQNAENARQANQLVVSASDFAVKGGQVVSEVVVTMGSIKESSSKIVDIIGVIDGIAFQTNILALNAAVEAARAGEQGRGFAVVAAEVRNLAQRSANAAKEIKSLIGDSVEKVDAGSRLVDQAGNTMHEIVASVKRVADIMSEITAASQEQSAGIQEVGETISQMDQMTQQNATLVQEAASAAESLQIQANKLAEAVAEFKLAGGTETSAAGEERGLQKRPLSTAFQAPVDAKPARHAKTITRAARAKLSTAPPETTPAAPTTAGRSRQLSATAGEDWDEF